MTAESLAGNRPGGAIFRLANRVAAHRPHLLVLGGFFAFFLLLLLPIPLSGSMLGSADSLFIPALSNTYLNQVKAAISGELLGRSMYPASIARYGETILGVAGMFMVFRGVGFSNVYAQYLTQVSQLSLMAFAAFLLAKQYSRSWACAAFAGFAFSTSNYLWADIDHLPIHFYWLPLLCIVFLKRAAEGGRSRALLAAGVVGGLQMYFSVQVYVYQTLMVGVIILFNFRELWRGYSLREKGLFAAGYTLLALPLVLFYLNTVLNLGVMDPFPRGTFEGFFALQLRDFGSALPGKLIRYWFVRSTEGGWHRVSHSAFIGFAIPVLAMLGLKPLSKRKLELAAIMAVGLLFALGSSIQLGETRVVSPLNVFYQFFPLAQYLRVGHRSYSLAILAASLLAGIGLDRVAKRFGGRKRGAALVLVAFVVVAGENISWPLNEYETLKYPSIPDGYVEFFRDKPEAVILDLPSNSTSWPLYIDDIIYVIWQTEHKRNIVGGVSGYFPPSRIDAQHYINGLPSTEAFQYFMDLGVTHFVWHDSPYLVCHAPHATYGCDPLTGTRSATVERAYPWSDGSLFLKLVFRNDYIFIYELLRDKPFR